MSKRYNKKLLAITIVIVAVIAVSAAVFFGRIPAAPGGNSFSPNICNSADCFTENAVKREDPTICDNIGNGSEKSDCYINMMQIAIEKKDSDICNNITENGIRDGCNAAINATKAAAAGGGAGGVGGAGSPAQTQISCSLSGPMYQSCLLQFARETLDPAFCYLIIDNNERDRCLMILAVMNYDESLCDKISDQEKIGVCHLYMTREFIPYNESGMP
jgi:hypothetical protein